MENRHQYHRYILIHFLSSSKDQAIAQDNQVRLINLFVDPLKLADFGFDFIFAENSRTAYHPADLLKIFMYGYLNRMRFSRVTFTILELKNQSNTPVLLWD